MQTLLDTYEEAIRVLPITVTSPQKWVTVRRLATGEVNVSLHPRTLAKLTERELTMEIESAFNEAYLTYRDECRKLRRKIFGSDFDEIHTRGEEWHSWQPTYRRL